MTDDSLFLPALARFFNNAEFDANGAVFTDLDGTAVHEVEGRAVISPTVEAGLAAIHAAGRHVVVNTLRSPSSVIRVFGREWYRITGAAMPLVALNGSQIGYVVSDAGGQLVFKETAGFPLDKDDVRRLMTKVHELVDNGSDDLLLFLYPRDWLQGERIWVSRAERVQAVATSFNNPSQVFTAGLEALEAILMSQPLCMVVLLEDSPEDRAVIYRHTERTRFVTHAGIDKRHGAVAIADQLKLSLTDSIGAGDAPTDNFLDAVGFAVIVGDNTLVYKGVHETVCLLDPTAFGRLLMQVAQR
jgi:hydroxymethylpyrimidine pyrophosphatase-like HAD family hydrolase